MHSQGRTKNKIVGKMIRRADWPPVHGTGIRCVLRGSAGRAHGQSSVRDEQAMLSGDRGLGKPVMFHRHMHEQMPHFQVCKQPARSFSIRCPRFFVPQLAPSSAAGTGARHNPRVSSRARVWVSWIAMLGCRSIFKVHAEKRPTVRAGQCPLRHTVPNFTCGGGYGGVVHPRLPYICISTVYSLNSLPLSGL